MRKDAFASFHPTVNLSYFAAVITFAMFLTHPVFLILSICCGAAYAAYLKKITRISLLYMIPMLIITVVLNPLFNHRGATILAYLPNGNPLTLESILFGIAAGIMLITVITWFSCFNAVMTSDKFTYLFGRAIPALSLILSTSLRLVPRFAAQIKVIANAQRCIGRDISKGSLLKRVKCGVKILSIMVTWMLENSIETADSMKNRGYGLPGRTAFSIFRFTRQDGYALVYIFFCASFIIFGTLSGASYFRYFPTVRGEWLDPRTIAVFAAYLALGVFPLMLNLREDIIWKRIESKI